MIILTLVRHGQASYLSDDYDKLSALGERQAALLGEYWAQRDMRFDAVFSGPAQRQIRTAEIVAAAYRKLGRDLPASAVLDEFDEFPGEQVVRVLGPILVKRRDDIRDLADAFHNTQDEERKRKALDVLFHRVAHCWVAGEAEAADVESWPQFTARVAGGVACIRNSVKAGDGTRVVVFTSAGPTAVVASLSLSISGKNTLELAFSPHNASYSEFILTTNGIALSTFNVTAHIEDRSLLTYR